MVLPLCSALHGQGETSPLAERYRQRHLSANERAIESFFQRNLPLGWYSNFTGEKLELSRRAPVYTIRRPEPETKFLSKPALFQLAKKKGEKNLCTMEFHVERHDDTAIVKRKVRLYKEIRRDASAAFQRLRLPHLCGSTPMAECAIGNGPAAEAAREYLTTRQILIEKLEITPLYRVGTLYLYPKKNQCVPEELDWYVSNTRLPVGAIFMPLEAREEIEIILKNLEQLKLWE